MFHNYLKIILRNIVRHKIYSLINIAGLAIGIACCMIILFWVQDEMSYDKFHENYDEIYRAMSYGTRYFIEGIDGTPAPLAPAVKEAVPEVKDFTRFAMVPRIIMQHAENAFYEDKVVIADPSIFSMFTFPFKEGDPRTAFSQPFDLVMTESTAKKYFGEENPIGKTIEVEGITAAVTGVIEDLPANSHLQFDILTSFEFINQVSGYGTSWGSFNFVTYFQIQAGADLDELSGKITEVAEANNCPQVMDGVQFRLQALSSIHLDPRGNYRNYNELGDSNLVLMFSIIAAFILFIACFNFINLSTARSASRMKEVGMRKTIGASRLDLVKQFMGESIIYALIASLFALILVEFLTPVFNHLAGKELVMSFADGKVILNLIIILFITGVIAGFYPALYLSKFKPAMILKNANLATNITARKNRFSLRGILIGIQFILAVVLILGTTAIHQQISFIRNKNLGFNKDNVLWVPLKDNLALKYEVVKQALLADPSVANVSAQDYMSALNCNRTTSYSWEGKDPEYEVDMLISRVDYDFFELMGIDLTEGRFFNEQYKTDMSEAYILNQESISKMQMDSPLGKKFVYNEREGHIIGVIKNVNWRSLHIKIEPHVFIMMENPSHHTSNGILFVKIADDNTDGAIASLKNIWEEFNPHIPFEYHFMDETYEKLYRLEKNIGAIVSYFTMFTIMIASLGLFGLINLLTEQRTKEIGIRKVLGATVVSILKMISIRFIMLVALSNVIAWPIAYYAVIKVLQNYAYRLEFSDWFWIFPFGFVLSILITIVSVGIQSLRAATADPAKAIRYE